MIERQVEAPGRPRPFTASRSVAFAATAILAVLCLTLGACAAGSGESHHAAAGGALSQLLLGLWHGIIGPVMLIVEIINRFAPGTLPWKVHFYESQGTGVIYDIGFFLGLVGSPVAIGSGWSRRG